MTPWLLLLGGWLSMALVMSGIWLVQRQTNNAGFVDVAWTFGVGVLGIVFALAGDGDFSRRVLVAVLIGGWSLRLGSYILRRVLTEPEDGRYRGLKEQWGASAQSRLFGFYQIQAPGAVIFGVPMLLAGRNSQPLGILDLIGVAIWIVSVAGEALADRQLAQFKRDPANQGKVCNVGLWRYSRHPNYFFEWLHWWTYVPMAVFAPWGWLSLTAPAAMWYFITRVTGIPPTEAQSLRSRGAAYREYQRTTNAFFPGPPKSEARPSGSDK